jgi:polyisoprenoid-binding protein YceI
VVAACGASDQGGAGGAVQPSPARTGLAGRWAVASGSRVGYRVREQFIDESAPNDAVANTSKVTGGLTVVRNGASWIARDASFQADLTALKSIDSHATRGPLQRDRFVGPNFLDTRDYPTASFQPDPIEVRTSASSGAPVDLMAHGNLTIHGQTHAIDLPLRAQLTTGRISVTGSRQIDMTDYGVRVPALPFTKADSQATIVFDLTLQPA